MFELLKELSYINATSGDEGAVREYVIDKIKNVRDIDFHTDNLGNLYVNKKGKKTPKNKIMIAAHMDEVGFIISHIGKDGFLSFKNVGGINSEVVVGKQVQFKSGLIGVIGDKPIHKQKAEEREKPQKIENLYIDIGAESDEEVKKQISLGDNCYFVSEFFEFGSGFIKGKAIDDRLGCAIMIDMILSETEYDVTFVFTVQEEVGTRGAGVATFNVKPDIALVLESTTAADIPSAEGGKKVCKLGEGTVVSFMDMGTIYDKGLYNLAFEVAKENNLNCQTKTMIAGGNDSGIIHKSVGGVRTIALSAPTRYLHSPSCVIKRLDLAEMRILTEKLTEAAANI